MPVIGGVIVVAIAIAGSVLLISFVQHKPLVALLAYLASMAATIAITFSYVWAVKK